MLAAVVAASVALPVAAAARPAAVPAPAPGVPFEVRAATPAALAQRYAANRDGIRAAARMAAAHGDRRRADSLRAMAAPGRRFVSFDGRDGGRSAEVFGDLARAGRIAVLVPGADTGLDAYGRFRAGAEALHGELRADPAGGGPDAVVAWLGYATPSTLSPESLTADRAEAAAPRLRAFVRSLTAARPGVRISLLCHSYGSVVCGRAAAGLRVADIVLYGSPGVGADTAAGLRTPAAVWAGRGADDWVGKVPHVRIPLLVTVLGFGRDPVSPAFGACPFPAGAGGHSDYLTPGSVPLRSMAGIVRGEAACARPGVPGEAAGPHAAVTAALPRPYAHGPGPAARHHAATALPPTPRPPFPYARAPALQTRGGAHA